MDPNAYNILQWNINGLRGKITQLQCLLTKYNPHIITLQETKLPNEIKYENKRFTMYYKNRDGDGGGVAILINNNIPAKQLMIQTPLEAVAATVYYQNIELTVCSLYLRPGEQLPRNEIINLLELLPSPFLILGDVNGKHHSWGSPHTQNPDISHRRGVELFDIIEHKYMHILNTGSPTYYKPKRNYYSHLDLSFCTPNISGKFNWETDPELYDSDHFPIILTHTMEKLYIENPVKWDIPNTPIEKLRSYSEAVTLPDEFHDPTIACQEITEHILEVAQQHIKIKNGNINTKYFNPWWNDECKRATKEKRRALQAHRRHPNNITLLAFQKAAAIARRTIKEAKRTSWCRFVNKINRFTPIKTIWKKIKKIDNKSYKSQKTILNINNHTISNPAEVIHELGSYFTSIPSNNNYTADFLVFKNQQELLQLNFLTDNLEDYNKPFNLYEFNMSLQPNKDTTPGDDNIPYDLYRLLPSIEKEKLVKFFNYIWSNQSFPTQWSNAHVIPIPKPNKPPTDPSSYRPISLTRTLGKIMEKMISKRLMTFLTKNKIIVDYQYGFQKNKSTLDPLVQLENMIRDTIIWDEFLVVVFLDIQKAYDMVWAFGLLKELHDIGLRGNLPIFIKNFMSNRTLQVKIATFLSRKFHLENGLPQGSILSVFLFLLAINKLFLNCDQTINQLFCDDGMLWSRSSDLATAETKIQNTLDKLTQWSKATGLQFSPQKTTYCIFTHKKTRHLNLSLCGNNLTRSYIVKYLGVIFDHRLNWVAHILYLKEKCHKRLAILRCVAYKKWGADRSTLRTLYLSLIQSQLNYASFLLVGANHTKLEILDRIQYEGIRIITGALKITRVRMLEAEAFIMPLNFRRHYLGLTFLGRAARLENNITNRVFANHFHFQFYDTRNKPLSWIDQAHRLLNNMDLNLGEISKINSLYLYQTPETNIKYTMHIKSKSTLSEIEAQQLYFEMITMYLDFHHIFTDGSVKENKTGCAVINGENSHLYRLPDQTNIFTAELYAIFKAIEIIDESIGEKFLICSDSLSALQAIQGGTINALVHNIYEKLTSSNKEIHFEWVPSHLNLQGNSQADEKAKLSLELPQIEQLSLEYIDYENKVKKELKIQWQTFWDSDNEYPNTTDLYPIKPILKVLTTSNRRNRQEEVVLSRLRLGACLFNKKHKYKGEPHPICNICQEEMSISHMLLDCPNYTNERSNIIQTLNQLGLPKSLASVLSNEFPLHHVFTFLRITDFYNKI